MSRFELIRRLPLKDTLIVLAGSAALAGFLAVAIPKEDVAPDSMGDPCEVVATLPPAPLSHQTWDQLRKRTDPANRCGIVATDAALNEQNPNLHEQGSKLQAGTTGNDKYKDVLVKIPVFGYFASTVTEGTAPPPEFTTQS